MKTKKQDKNISNHKLLTETIPITIDEYNLITVITQSTPYVQIIKNKKKIRTPFKPESKKKKEKRPARNKKVNIDFY